jgi:hypothetical protein
MGHAKSAAVFMLVDSDSTAECLLRPAGTCAEVSDVFLFAFVFAFHRGSEKALEEF